MYATPSDKRKSGIPLVGDLSWGTHFCHFFQTKKDLLDIFVPYFKAGLENNELCVWVTSGLLGEEEAKKALEKAVPHFQVYAGKGQVEIVPHSRWHASGGEAGDIVSRLDRAISGGFDGLRLARSAIPEKKGSQAFPSDGEADAISRHNVIAVFAYPREEFDAMGLMEVVKNHRFALVRNAGRWEVIESSQARIAKDALIRNEEKLRSLFSHMAEGFAYCRLVLDDRGKPSDYVFLEVNDAFGKLTGLKGKKVIGKRVTEVLPGIEKDPTDWIGRFGKVALTGKPERFESYAELLQRWYSVSAFSPHKGYFGVTFSDITERKRAENELLEAKEEWERTFDSVPDLIAILDDRQQVVRVNRAMADRLGVAPDQCAGLRCYEVVHGMPGPPGFCPFSQTCHDGKEHVAEVREPRLGGDFMVSTTPLCSPEGRFAGVVHVARDITERKQAEEALQRKTEELARSNADLEQFAYVASHDLQEPLRMVSSYVQLLAERYRGKLDADADEFIGYAYDGALRMQRLISDLLTYSRVSTRGKAFEEASLEKALAQALDNLKLRISDSNATITHDPLPPVWADIAQLAQVFQNLLDNAIKFHGDRPPQIHVSASLNGDECLCSVRDNGIGIAPEYMSKLFVLFQRLHTRKEYPGTGIGLALCKKIVERHGGRIWVESKPGEGSTFCFAIPTVRRE